MLPVLHKHTSHWLTLPLSPYQREVLEQRLNAWSSSVWVWCYGLDRNQLQGSTVQQRTRVRSCHCRLPPRPPTSTDEKQSATRWFTSIRLQSNHEKGDSSGAFTERHTNQWPWATKKNPSLILEVCVCVYRIILQCKCCASTLLRRSTDTSAVHCGEFTVFAAMTWNDTLQYLVVFTLSSPLSQPS